MSTDPTQANDSPESDAPDCSSASQILQVVAQLEQAAAEHDREFGEYTPLCGAVGLAIGALRILADQRLTIKEVVKLAAYAGVEV